MLIYQLKQKYNNLLYSDNQTDEENIMKLLVTDCIEEIPIALDGVHEGNGSKVNDTTIEDEEDEIRYKTINSKQVNLL